MKAGITLKVAILTYHFAINYGAVLQAYALTQTIKEQIPHSDPYLIDLQLNAIKIKDRVRILPISTSLRTIKSGSVTIGQRINKEQLFKSFIQENFNLSQPYSSYKQLQANPPMAEIYICGSDQVWNPFITFGNIKPYLLEFISEHQVTKVAYAASIGGTKIKSKYQPTFTKALTNFDHISMREAEGVNAIQELTTKNVVKTLDPTLLLNKSQWQKLQVPIDYQDFILIYNIFPSKKVYEVANRLKVETGLQVIEISRYGEQPDFLDHPLIEVSPGQFLSLFDKASYVLTNSFHGTSFSIIYQKPFLAFASDMYTNRISNLLQTAKITSQQFTEDLLESATIKDRFIYDYQLATNNIQEDIIASKKFIKNIKEDDDKNR